MSAEQEQVVNLQQRTVQRYHKAMRNREEVVLEALALLKEGNVIAAKALLRNRAREWGLIGE